MSKKAKLEVLQEVINRALEESDKKVKSPDAKAMIFPDYLHSAVNDKVKELKKEIYA